MGWGLPAPAWLRPCHVSPGGTGRGRHSGCIVVPWRVVLPRRRQLSFRLKVPAASIDPAQCPAECGIAREQSVTGGHAPCACSRRPCHQSPAEGSGRVCSGNGGVSRGLHKRRHTGSCSSGVPARSRVLRPRSSRRGAPQGACSGQGLGFRDSLCPEHLHVIFRCLCT